MLRNISDMSCLVGFHGDPSSNKLLQNDNLTLTQLQKNKKINWG